MPIAEAEAEGDSAVLSTNKAPLVKPAGNLASQQSGGATNGIAATDQQTATASSLKDLPAMPEVTARGNDLPAPPANMNASQTSTPAAFGSELKLVTDVTPQTETAAARNAPNAAASQVAVQINRAVQDGQDKFVVNLKPATLGKVSVTLEVGHDNRVVAVIAAERPDTLELLQRDSRALELALKDAGLKADSGSLSFSLQGESAEDSQSDEPSGSDHAMAITQDGDELDALATQNTYANAIGASGVDIHV